MRVFVQVWIVLYLKLYNVREWHKINFYVLIMIFVTMPIVVQPLVDINR